MFLAMDRFPPERVAAVDDRGASITYGELCAFPAAFAAHALRRSVLVALCQNCVGALAGYVACMEAEVVPLLLNAAMDPTLLQTLLDNYRPRYLWLPEPMREAYPQYWVCFARYGYALLDTGNALYPLYDDLGMLLCTSGSTGCSKLVRHKKDNPRVNAEHVAQFFGLHERDRAMADLPMQYTMGLNVILSHLFVGAKVLLASRNLMDPEFWTFFREEGATVFTGVPFSYEVLFRLRFTEMQLPALRIIAEGGGKLTDKMFTALAEYARATGRQFFATFGTTETTARLAYLPPELATLKTGSIGRAIPGGELFLRDENGSVLETPVAEGELGYRGPNVTLGYAQRREDLAKGDEFGGTYLTGDLARRDADGCYYVMGRKGRFLKLYGLRVSLDECECLIKTAFDTDCACVGDDLQMRIYVTQPQMAKDVRTYISDKTGLIARAFEVKAIPALPKGESGKTRYAALP